MNLSHSNSFYFGQEAEKIRSITALHILYRLITLLLLAEIFSKFNAVLLCLNFCPLMYDVLNLKGT